MLDKLLNDKNVINIYQRDSHLYGVSHENSDKDFIIIVNNLDPFIGKIQHIKDKDDFTFYSKDQWIQKSKKQDVEFIECVFAPDSFKIKETFLPNFTIDSNLRHSFSKTSSNSWVKAKKKLTLDKDLAPYIGRKSLWHSLRILMFATDVVKNKKIDYTQANMLYNDIVMSDKSWDELKKTYQPLKNKLQSDLRLLINK